MKKWKNLKEIRTEMGLFDFSVITLIGDYKETGRYVAWKFDDKDFDLEKWDMDYIPRGKCFFRRGYVPIIWIPRKPRSGREYATLSHEALHAVFHLFEWASLPISRDTEEVVTHSMSHIITNSLK